MTNQIVHFEIIGTDPARLQAYYRDLFGWTYELGDTVSAHVSEPGQYGSVGAAGLYGGVGGGASLHPEGRLVVGQFTDPEGNLVGVAGER